MSADASPLPRNFGWNAVKLSEHSMADLTRLREAVEADPKSANTAGGIYLYTKAARRKLDAIGWAIYHKQKAHHALPSASEAA